ncbi:MAG: D-alanyl-D-alanine carboxypeptidase family protein [Christensenellales bacterium]
MKKRFAAVLAACLLLCCMPSSAAAMPEVSAKRACVIEVDSGLILEGKNENEKAEPASITKIMTALIALENYDKTKVITVPKKAAGVEGSSVYLKAGDKYTMEDFYALMLAGNDAATAIALTAGNGKVDTFVDNESKAKDLAAPTRTLTTARPAGPQSLYLCTIWRGCSRGA